MRTLLKVLAITLFGGAKLVLAAVTPADANAPLAKAIACFSYIGVVIVLCILYYSQESKTKNRTFGGFMRVILWYIGAVSLVIGILIVLVMSFTDDYSSPNMAGISLLLLCLAAVGLGAGKAPKELAVSSSYPPHGGRGPRSRA